MFGKVKAPEPTLVEGFRESGHLAYVSSLSDDLMLGKVWHFTSYSVHGTTRARGMVTDKDFWQYGTLYLPHPLSSVPFLDLYGGPGGLNAKLGIPCLVPETNSAIAQGGIPECTPVRYSNSTLVDVLRNENDSGSTLRIFGPTGGILWTIDVQNGELHGQYREFHDSGALAMEAIFVNGVVKQSIRSFFESGQLRSEYSYDEFGRVIETTAYREDGSVELRWPEIKK
jgi:hypothetical protein